MLSILQGIIAAAIQKSGGAPAPITLGVYAADYSLINALLGSITVPRPDGLVEGTLLLAIVSRSSNTTITPPSGWTQIYNLTGVITEIQTAFYKVATASEPDYYTFTNSANDRISALILSIGGHDEINPINVSATGGAAGNSLSHSAPSVTTTQDACLLILSILCAWSQSTLTYTPPAGSVELVDEGTIVDGGMTNAVATLTAGAAGATGAKVFVPGVSTGHSGATIAVKPGAGQAETPAYEIAEPVVASFQSTNANVANVTSVTVTKPVSLAVGDLMVAQISVGTPGATIVPPAGWKELYYYAPGNVVGGVYWKVAESGEPANYTFSWTGAARAIGVISRVTGAHPSRPIRGYSAHGFGSNSNPHPCPGCVCFVDNSLLMAFNHGGWGTQTSTPPTGMTEVYDIAGGTAGTAFPTVAMATLGVDKGDTGIKSFTPSFSNRYVSGMVLIAPAESVSP